MYNPFIGSKAVVFQTLMETDDRLVRATYLQQILQGLPEAKAKEMAQQINLSNAGKALGELLGSIFFPHKKR